MWEHFSTFVAKSDLYCCFIQQAIDLAKPGGLISFVVSDGWLRLDSFQAIRKYILSQCSVLELIDLPGKVFENATVKTGIFVLQKKRTDDKRASNQLRVFNLSMNSVTPELLRKIPQFAFENTPRNVFDLSLSSEMQSVKQSMESEHPKLADLVDIRFGLKTGDDEKFIHEFAKTKRHKPLLRGENIHRYKTEFAGEYVWYVPEKMREHRKTARPGDIERFEQPKILVRDTGSRFECTLDQDNYYVKDVLILTSAVNNRYSLHYITGLLNSKAMRFYYETTFPTLHVQNSELAILPIRRINFDDPADQRRHDRIVGVGRRDAATAKGLRRTPPQLDDQRAALQKRIAASRRRPRRAGVPVVRPHRRRDQDRKGRSNRTRDQSDRLRWPGSDARSNKTACSDCFDHLRLTLSDERMRDQQSAIHNTCTAPNAVRCNNQQSTALPVVLLLLPSPSAC